MQNDFIVEGIDIQAGRARYLDNTYIDVLKAYNKHTPPLLDILRRREPIEEYITTIHGIKGASSGICANDVAKRAADLEAAARSGDTHYIDEHNGPFIEILSALLQQLNNVLAESKQPASDKPMVSAPDTTLLSDLLAACKQYKSSQMEEILSNLEASRYETGGDLVEWLRDQVDNLEYEAIQKRLESIDL